MTQQEKEIYKKYKIDKMTEEDFIRFVMIFLHHFATPLAPILGYLDLLKRGEIKGTKRIYSVFIDKLKRLAKLRSEMINVTELYYNKKYREPKQEVIEINKKAGYKQPKILMVEDDPFLRDIYKIKFEEAGFEVTIFTDAENNIVEKVIEENPDIILSNVVMPGINGWEIIKLLKADKRTKDIPFVFLTSLSQEDEREKGLRLGATDYLVKAKFTPDEVVERVGEYLIKIKK